MRALVLTTSYPLISSSLSGVFVRELLTGLGENGWRFDILTPAMQGASSKIREDPITVHPVVYPGLRWGLAHERGLPEALASHQWKWLLVPGFIGAMHGAAERRVREQRYDLVWSHWLLPSGLIGAGIARRHGLPHVSTAHGADVHMLERLVRLPGVRRVLQARFSGTRLTAPARRTAQRVSHALAGAPVDELPLPAERGPTPDPRVASGLRLLYMGRFEPIKGPDLLLEAAMRAGAGAISELVFAGSGSLQSSLKASSVQAKFPTRFAGVVHGESKREALRRADVVVLPSRRLQNGRSEGLPHVALESLAQGTPVVAPRGGALGDLLEQSGAGIAYADGSSGEGAVRALSSVLQSLASSPGDIVALRSAAYSAGAAFCKRSVSRRWDGFLRGVPAVPSSHVALVIPARDEERLLPTVLASIPDWVRSIVLVDDGSQDSTWAVMTRWTDPRAVRIRSERAMGVGAAILSGYTHALGLGADVAVVVAADAQMDLQELASMVDPIECGLADCVQGSRFHRGVSRGRMPWSRWLGNRVLSAACTWAAGETVSDSQCGFTAVSARFLQALDPARLSPGYGFPAYMRLEALRIRMRVAEVPVSARYGDEVSGINPVIDPPRILARILWHGLRRRLSGSHTAAPRALTSRDPGFTGETR